MKNYVRAPLRLFLGLTLLLLFCCPASAAEHKNSFTERKTSSYSQTISCPTSSSTYLRRVSSSSQRISGTERLGSEGNVIGSFTGTEVVTVTDSFVKGRATKVRKTTTTTTKTFTSLSFDEAVTKKLIGLIDYRLKRAWEQLGFSIKVDAGYGRSIALLSAEKAIYVGPYACFEDILYCMGHFSSFVCGNLHTTSGWRTIWNAEKGQIQGAYQSRALLSPEEMYCVSFYNLCRKPSSLRRSAPRAYAYVQSAPEKLTKTRLSQLARAYARLKK